LLGFVTETLCPCPPQIATSEGDLPYKIQAQPVQNIYRLAPIVGPKVPAGVPNIRPIVLYNPHNEVSAINLFKVC
jgi:hypothetical protein